MTRIRSPQGWNAFNWMCADLLGPGVQARLMRRTGHVI